jgi:hypothetical protein
MKLGRTHLEMLIWPLVALLCVVVMGSRRSAPLSDDSYQYLNVADNLSQGRGVVTTLVHFDSERSNGHIPAPLTTFPPGYPVAIAVVSRLTGGLESAARLLSGIAYAGTAALLLWGLLAVGTNFFVRQAILLAFVANAVNLSMATAVLTESTYMLVATGAVFSLIALETRERKPSVDASIAVLACTLAGISYYIRYAGLFLIAAVIAFTLLRFVFQSDRLRTVRLIATSIPLLLAGAIMLRNVSTVGTWRGGNDMQVHNPLSVVTADYVRAQVHLMLGQHAFRFGVWELLLLLGVSGVAVVLIVALRNADLPRLNSAVILVGFYVGIYSAGIFYAGLRTPISFGTRMFLPMLPAYLLFLGIILSWLAVRCPSGWPGVLFKSAILLGIVGYFGTNSRDLSSPQKSPQYEILAEEYAHPIAGGPSLLDWVQSHVSPADRLFSEDGQATGYFLHRPTVSMVGPRYSPVRWECAMVRREMARFGAHYLILYKDSSSTDDIELLASSSFLAGAASQNLTCGFAIAAENSVVRILELPQVRN